MSYQIESFDFTGKRVLVRVDFNVPLNDQLMVTLTVSSDCYLENPDLNLERVIKERVFTVLVGGGWV